MKKDTGASVTKETLLNALLNTYDNSRFLIGEATEEGANFFLGIAQARSKSVSKCELLELVRTKAGDIAVSMPGHPGNLVFCPSIHVYRNLINENQIIHTIPLEGYLRLTDRFNANHDVYYRLDKERKTISFMLGDKMKTLELVEYSGFTYALRGNKMLCITADDLERFINDISWSPRMVVAGRRALKIKDAV